MIASIRCRLTANPLRVSLKVRNIHSITHDDCGPSDSVMDKQSKSVYLTAHGTHCSSQPEVISVWNIWLKCVAYQYATVATVCLIIKDHTSYIPSLRVPAKYPQLLQGKECCSDYVISFHYIDAATMHSLNFLIYHLKPYGLISSDLVDQTELRGRSLFEYAKQKAIENSPLSVIPTMATEEGEIFELRREPSISPLITDEWYHRPAIRPHNYMRFKQ